MNEETEESIRIIDGEGGYAHETYFALHGQNCSHRPNTPPAGYSKEQKLFMQNMRKIDFFSMYSGQQN